MELRKPIMITCAGRSGSTMYYRVIARHRDLGWLSTYNQVFPSQLWLSVFSNLYHVKAFDKVKHAHCFPKPFSPYGFWERYLPGVARHDRPLNADDVPEESIEPLRRAIAKVLKYQRRKRFLMKVTGWGRMAYFDRVFPDALFIYLKREPIAVVSSWINAGWLNVEADIDSKAWEWGSVPEEYRQINKELGGGPFLSAAIKTQLDIDDIQRNIELFPQRSYALNYEDLVVDPHRYFRETLDFCELTWDEDFERVVTDTGIRNYKDKWKRYIPPEHAERILEFFARANAVGLSSGCGSSSSSSPTE